MALSEKNNFPRESEWGARGGGLPNWYLLCDWMEYLYEL